MQDANIDILSPQLYSSGYETSPDFAETSSCVAYGCTWNLYENSKASFAPSIVTADQYAASTTYFASNYNIRTNGYIQWAQTVSEVPEEFAEFIN